MNLSSLIGAAFIDPAIAERLAADTKLKAPGPLAPVLRAIRALVREGVPVELLRVGERLKDEQLVALGGLAGLSALVADADLAEARRLVGLGTGTPPATAELEKSPITFDDVAELMESPVEPVFLVEGVIEDATTGALFGESTAGKSFVAVSLACSVATGTEWAGHAIERPGSVLYIAGEGRHGIPRRVASWQVKSGVPIPRGRLYLSRMCIEFNQTGARLIADTIEKTLACPPALVVVDTVARSLPPGSDENSAADIMAFINAVDSIRDRFGCVVCLVHHTGHAAEAQSRARGSSAFRAAMDWEICIDRRKQQVAWTKMKDAELPPPIGFEIEQVGQSAVAVFKGAVDQSGPDLTKAEEFALNTFQETLSRLGRSWATTDEWRSDFYRRHTGATSEAKRKAFERSRKQLAEAGHIRVDNDTYSMTRTTRTVPDKTAFVPDRPDRPLKVCPGVRVAGTPFDGELATVETVPVFDW